MANKNTARIRRSLAKHKSIEVEVPTGTYHNNAKGAFRTQRIELVKYVHKKKAKPFPVPDNSPAELERVSLANQRKVFYGIPGAILN